MSDTVKITEEQFNEYLIVQESGAYNMLDRRAREMTSLSRTEWIELISNYDKYKELYKNTL
tara:strand:- start:1581 stop:1763 length:183 start_codon:yes stop_codon:yes gene_type:complete